MGSAAPAGPLSARPRPHPPDSFHCGAAVACALSPPRPQPAGQCVVSTHLLDFRYKLVPSGHLSVGPRPRHPRSQLHGPARAAGVGIVPTQGWPQLLLSSQVYVATAAGCHRHHSAGARAFSSPAPAASTSHRTEPTICKMLQRYVRPQSEPSHLTLSRPNHKTSS